MSKPKYLKVKCSDCSAVVINGVACHETGCPASKRPWVVMDGYIIPGDLEHEIYNEDEETENE